MKGFITTMGEAAVLAKWRGQTALRQAARLLGVSHEAISMAEKGRMRFDDDRIRRWADSPNPVVAELGLNLWLARNRKTLMALVQSFRGA